jgi:hypothetical protein
MTNGCADCGDGKNDGVGGGIEAAASNVLGAIAEFTEAVALIEAPVLSIDEHTVAVTRSKRAITITKRFGFMTSFLSNLFT